MRSGRNWLVWGGALLLLLGAGLITTLTARQDARAEPFPLGAHSPAPDGALALYMWTERLGRDVDYLEYEPFELDREDALLVSLQPFDEYDGAEREHLRQWLLHGGSLLLATDSGSEMMQALGFDIEPGEPADTVVPSQPLLLAPPVERVSADASHTVTFEQGVPLLSAGSSTGPPVLVARTLGVGRVWVFSAPGAFSNASLGEADNWKLYLNVLGKARSGRVRFDEYHRGKPDLVSLRTYMLQEPWGWALIYTGVIVLVYLMLRGRRLGRPLRLGRTRYRSSGEYVRSLASLLRSAGKSEYPREHFAASYVQTLRKVSGLPARVSVDELQRAAEESTGTSARKVAEAARALRGTIDEERILRLVREAEQERKQLMRRRHW